MKPIGGGGGGGGSSSSSFSTSALFICSADEPREVQTLTYTLNRANDLCVLSLVDVFEICK